MPNDVVLITKNNLTAQFNSANVDNITLTIDDGGVSGQVYKLTEITDLVRVFRAQPTRKTPKGISIPYASREDTVTIKLNTGGAGSKTPGGVDIRAHHVKLQNEIERALQVVRINPDPDWDVGYPTSFTYTKEFPDEVESVCTVYYRRVWRPMEV